jgi:alkylation response protein AidB-like acyl-CoA dehydrogenase
MTIDTSRMSEGKRAALELAEASREADWEHQSFAAALFMGRVNWPMIHPYPDQPPEDAAAGAPFLARLETFLREKVDPDHIDRTGEIPQPIIDELAAMGAFGIKIPTEYGGLGLSQFNYSRAAMLLGSYCGNVTALLSAHQSIGVPQPIKLFGTEEQKRRYLPRVAGGEISAFALTEVGAGSDPARMETRAEPTPDGTHFILNGEKLWCTNGTRAGIIVVMARTPAPPAAGKTRNAITAFLLEMNTPGVTVTHRCHFMGLRSLYNAVIRFENVRVPRENILFEEGRGLKVALTTLNTGRLTLPAACIGLSKRCLEVTRRWANERVQWGAPIGKHAAIADKIARMASSVFAMESMTMLTAALVDRGNADIRLEAAMCKMYGSEAAWRIVDDAMQIRGGRGYETAGSLQARGEPPIAVERYMRDCRINLIFEGSSEIMRLFIAREALDPHLKAGGAVLDGRLPGSARLGAAVKALAYYARWYPRQWLPLGAPGARDLHPRLAAHAGFAAGAGRRLARGLFHAMARHGPRLEREQMLLGRFIDVGTDLFALCASCARAHRLLEQGRPAEEVLPLIEYLGRSTRHRVAGWFRAVGRNEDRRGYALARQVLEGRAEWLEQGIVGSPIRRHDNPASVGPGND